MYDALNAPSLERTHRMLTRVHGMPALHSEYPLPGKWDTTSGTWIDDSGSWKGRMDLKTLVLQLENAWGNPIVWCVHDDTVTLRDPASWGTALIKVAYW